MLITMAWRNLWRQRRRSLVTSSALAVGIALCMATICFQDGFYQTIREVIIERTLGHLQMHHPDYPGREHLHDTLQDSAERLASLDAHPDILKSTVRLRGQGLVGGSSGSEGAELTGVDPGREDAATDIGALLVEGRYLAEEPAHEAVLGVELARTLELGVDDELLVVTQAADGSMGNDLYQIVGLLSTGNERFDKLGVQLHIADAQELLVLPDQVHEIVVVTRSGVDLVTSKQDLSAPEFARGALVRTWSEVNPDMAKMLGMQDFAAAILLVIILSVAAIVVLNTMMMVVFERTREIGLLKALGMRPGRIVQLIAFEALSIATVAVILGVTLGGLLDAYLVHVGVNMVEEDLVFNGIRISGNLQGYVEVKSIAYTILFAYVVSMVASLWPAWRAARLQPVTAMRQD
jgi:ABC-type lipoprotein release transport system permease subunit